MVSSSLPRSAIDFDPYSEAYFNSPYEIYRRLRDEAPVYYSPKHDFWALSRYEDVAPAYKDFETYSSARGFSLDTVQDPNRRDDYPVILVMDPPQHNRMRKLVSKVFTPRAIQGLEQMVRETIEGYANRLNPKRFDAVGDFAAHFPMDVIANMLGVPAEDRQQIRLWLDTMLERQPGTAGQTPEGVEAGISTGAYYYNLVQQRRQDPQDDMISRLLETTIVEEGTERRLDDIEITGFASVLGGAGAETVTKLIGTAAVAFADSPEQWEELRNDRSKIPAAVEELIRYEGPSQYNVRYSLRDVTVHGITIPAGSAVMLINGSANRDERMFADPDRVDIHRQRPVGYNLGFGFGIHSCLGAALARMESRIALDVLLDLIPEYRIDRSGLRRVNMVNVMGWSAVPVRAPI